MRQDTQNDYRINPHEPYRFKEMGETSEEYKSKMNFNKYQHNKFYSLGMQFCKAQLQHENSNMEAVGNCMAKVHRGLQLYTRESEAFSAMLNDIQLQGGDVYAERGL